MKIRITAALLFLLFLFICSCKSTSEEEQDNEGSAGIIVIGFAQVGAESAWRLANTQSFIEAFGDSSKYELRIVDCHNTPSVQQAAVYDFIAQEVDYIVIAPIEVSGWQEILAEARDAGIPVIITDRMIDITDEKLYSFFVGGNFLQEGLDAMNWLNNYLDGINKSDEPLNVFHMQGQMGSSAQIGRTEGILAGIEQNRNLILLEQESGDFTMARGEEVMISWLNRYRAEEIDILIAENDDMAFGAIRAMNAFSIKPGEDILIISFDAGRRAVQAVADGLINCTIECNPMLGQSVRDNIDLMEAGVIPRKIQYAHTGKCFDITNAADELDTRY